MRKKNVIWAVSMTSRLPSRKCQYCRRTDGVSVRAVQERGAAVHSTTTLAGSLTVKPSNNTSQLASTTKHTLWRPNCHQSVRECLQHHSTLLFSACALKSGHWSMRRRAAATAIFTAASMSQYLCRTGTICHSRSDLPISTTSVSEPAISLPVRVSTVCPHCSKWVPIPSAHLDCHLHSF